MTGNHGAGTSSRFHLFETEHAYHVLVANGSRIYDLTPELWSDLASVSSEEDGRVENLLAGLGVSARHVEMDVPSGIPVRALSLAVAQKCNLACSYCYAGGGTFGGPARSMPWEVAKASIERLLRESAPSDRVNLAFLGGEPLANRDVVRRATRFAADRASALGVRMGFSITSNGTLLTRDDIAFFEEYGFAVTISLDGDEAAHDSLRVSSSGRGTYRRVLNNVLPALAVQKRMQVSARVTVTPRNLELRKTADHFVALGFHSVGFAPLLRSPSGRDELGERELEIMLEQMVDCGREFERQIVAGRRYPFSNMVSAMQELHKGTARPYPCGAGAGYFGVSADGILSACHRFVGDSAGVMGSVRRGVDGAAQDAWLAERHVDRQEPCQSCWARYLCGGGCHHEVIARGRPACNYIRGWLHYTLQAYVRLLDQRPDYFGMDESL